MKNAVMYGAGNIGRGFIGKVFSESGMDVVFIDVVQEVIDKLNEENEYPVRLVSNEIDSEVIVKNASAVSGFDQSAVTEAIINADIMATAVGVNIRSVPKRRCGRKVVWCPCRDSNPGTRFRKPPLYPPELQGHAVRIESKATGGIVAKAGA